MTNKVDSYIEKCSENLPVHRPFLPASGNDVILMTGALGLGRTASGAVGGKFFSIQSLRDQS